MDHLGLPARPYDIGFGVSWIFAWCDSGQGATQGVCVPILGEQLNFCMVAFLPGAMLGVCWPMLGEQLDIYTMLSLLGNHVGSRLAYASGVVGFLHGVILVREPCWESDGLCWGRSWIFAWCDLCLGAMWGICWPLLGEQLDFCTVRSVLW